MAKPLLSPIRVFDALKGATCYFKIPSGGTVTSYKYIIYDSLTNEEVCSKEAPIVTYTVVDGYAYSIDPDEKLINRARNYYIRLFVKLQNESEYGEASDALSFHCKLKPDLFFDTLIPDEENLIPTSTIIFSLRYTYEISQGETLNSYKYRLYNSEKKLLEESKVFYGNPSSSYTASGLDNRTVFYIRGIGTTKCGYSLDTGFIKIKTNYYASAESAAFLQCKNIRSEGYISVASHLVDITGITDDEISYVQIGDGYGVDLTHGEKIIFDLPYQIDFYRTQDYTMKFTVKPLIREDLVELILDQDGYVYKAVISTNIRAFNETSDKNEKFYAMLKVIREDGGYASADIYFINSNLLDYRADIGYIMIYLQHKNNSYELKVEEVDVG